MNVWRFLDNNAFLVFLTILAIVFTVGDCVLGGGRHEASGCGVHVSVGSDAKDAGHE